VHLLEEYSRSFITWQGRGDGARLLSIQTTNGNIEFVIWGVWTKVKAETD